MKKKLIILGLVLCLVGCSNTSTISDKQQEPPRKKTVAEKTMEVLDIFIASGLYNNYGISYGESIIKTKSTTDTKVNSDTKFNNSDMITHTETTSTTKSKSKGLGIGVGL